MRTLSVRKLPIVFPNRLNDNQREQIISHYFEHKRGFYPSGVPIWDYSDQIHDIYGGVPDIYGGVPIGKLYNIHSTEAMLYAEVGLIPLYDQFVDGCPEFVIFVSVVADLTKEPMDIAYIGFSLANKYALYEIKSTTLSEVKL